MTVSVVGAALIARIRGFVTSHALGPARRGAPGPVILRWGTPGRGAIDVLVALEGDELPPETVSQLRRVLQYTRRVVIARVVGAGRSAHVVKEAERFLVDAAASLRLDRAELQLLFGDLDSNVANAQRRGEFGIILRSDQPDDLFDGDGSRQEVRCWRDVPAT